MKWFKHYTDSLDDPFIHALIDKFGATGYLAYFGIIEIICKENGAELTGKLDISPTYLRRKLRTSQGKLRQVYDFCQGFAKLSVNFCENNWEFEFPKVAQIKDNYTKNFEVTSKKPSKQKDKEKEKEEDKEKEKDKKTNAHFKKFWDLYPKKKSKGTAEKAWNKINPNEQLLAIIFAKIEQAKTSVEWAEEGGKYIPYPATWLNGKRWEEEYTEKKGKLSKYDGIAHVE